MENNNKQDLFFTIWRNIYLKDIIVNYIKELNRNLKRKLKTRLKRSNKLKLSRIMKRCAQKNPQTNNADGDSDLYEIDSIEKVYHGIFNGKGKYFLEVKYTGFGEEENRILKASDVDSNEKLKEYIRSGRCRLKSVKKGDKLYNSLKKKINYKNK